MNRITMITEFSHISTKVFFAWNLRRFAQLNKIVSSLLIEYAAITMRTWYKGHRVQNAKR